MNLLRQLNWWAKCRLTTASRPTQNWRCAPAVARHNRNAGVLNNAHKMIKRIVLIALLALPFAAWAFVKPVRVLAPQVAGLTCHGKVCVDDQSRLSEATGLYANAVRYVRDNIGECQSEPRAVSCSTKACSESFGFT